MTQSNLHIIIVCAVLVVVFAIVCLVHPIDEVEHVQHHHHHHNNNQPMIRPCGNQGAGKPKNGPIEVRLPTIKPAYDLSRPILQNRRFRHKLEVRGAVHPQNKHTIVAATFTRKPSTSPVAVQIFGTPSYIGTYEIMRSMDGGKTWVNLGFLPEFNDHYFSFHYEIAYGARKATADNPSGKPRLYFCSLVITRNVTVPGIGNVVGGGRWGMLWSDDDGATWSAETKFLDPYSLGLTYPNGQPGQPNGGAGFMEMTVDSNHHSPNYGMVAVSYLSVPVNTSFLQQAYFATIVYSRDFGETWQATFMDPTDLATIGPFMSDFPNAPTATTANINVNFTRPRYARMSFAPNGDLYCLATQLGVRSAAPNSLGNQAFVALGWDVAQRIVIGANGVFKYPTTKVCNQNLGNFIGGYGFASSIESSHSIAVAPKNSTIYIANHDYIAANSPRCNIYIFKSTDGGSNWTRKLLPSIPGQSSARPEIAISPNGHNIAVSFVGLNDVMPVSTLPVTNSLNIGNYYCYSNDDGENFSAPIPLTDVRWNANAAGFDVSPTNPNASVSVEGNGVGLAHRLIFLDNQRAMALYTDARFGGSKFLPNNGPTLAQFETQANFGLTEGYATVFEIPQSIENNIPAMPGSAGQNFTITSNAAVSEISIGDYDQLHMLKDLENVY